MTQKDDDGQEWEISGITSILVGKVLTIEVDSYFPYASVEEEIALRDCILADHRDAQQLRERVRGLEEALRDRMPHCYTCDRVATRVGYGANFVYVCDEHQSDVRRSEPLDGVDGEHLALLSPAAATEGGEEA